MKKSENFRWGRVVISGMGVMGASLGYSLVRAKLVREVCALVRRPEICGKLVKMKLAHKATADICEAVTDSDMVILSVPASVVGRQVKSMLPYISGHTVISDLCSVKSPVVRTCERIIGTRAKFLSVHPMTGTEKFGFENYIRDLYRGMPCILTPSDQTSETVVSRVKKFWDALGADTFVLGPYEHDVSAALISHLPHVIAFAYFSGVLKQKHKHPHIFNMAAGSFRDVTRIAGSSPDLWADIFMNNRTEIIKSISLFKKEVDLFLKMLQKGNQANLFKTISCLSEIRRKMKI